ncbi:MAG: DUF1028 domain-containing protein [Acidobacteria bacterium]|nr:DUF1028 domain-containing protein [Acidobacteriota bacterium]
MALGARQGRRDKGEGTKTAARLRRLTAALVAITALASVHAAQHPSSGLPANGLPEHVATFSILGYDPDTGEVGGAVQSRVFSVGNGVLWGEANVGMAATQAIVDVSYGPQALALLRVGVTPSAIIKTIWDSDPDPKLNGRDWTKEGRQFAVMDAKGNYAAFTGPKATSWAQNIVDCRERRGNPAPRVRSDHPVHGRRRARRRGATRNCVDVGSAVLRDCAAASGRRSGARWSSSGVTRERQCPQRRPVPNAPLWRSS